MKPLDIERPRYTRRERLAWTDGFLAGFLASFFGIFILGSACLLLGAPW